MADPHPMSPPDGQETPSPSSDPNEGDLSLIRWLLSLSESERLAVLQAQADSLVRLRDAATER